MPTIKDFEEIAKKFVNYFQARDLAHADALEILEDKVIFLEETNLSFKDLTDDNVFEKELTEIVKKMAGSLTVFLWWLYHEYSDEEEIKFIFKKNRLFIVDPGPVESKFARLLSKMLRKINKFKNGLYDEIKWKENS